MKSLFRIYRHYVVMGILFLFLWGCLNLVILLVTAAYGYGADRSEDGKFAYGWERRDEIYGALVPDADKEAAMTRQGIDMLEEDQLAFAFLLSGEGDVIWSWELPDEFPRHYTATEIAVFSRWYLYDYPVFVRVGEFGLLVLGYPKGSLIKYNMTFTLGQLKALFRNGTMFVICNMLLVLLAFILSGYRFYRRLKPIAGGIDRLSAGEDVHVKEKGVNAELAGKLNHASEILQSQKCSLERRDMARTEWIAGVSHDIRTPLSMVLGYADSLEQDEILPGAARQQAGIIRQQAVVIRKLIEDLNLTSKLEYHMQPLRTDRFRPAAFLRETAVIWLNGGLPDGYELELNTDDSLEAVSINGDRSLMERAVSNLIQNSIRHNPAGCTILINGFTCSGRYGNGWCVGVRDSGNGIPEEIRRILLNEELMQGEEYDRPEGSARVHIMGLRIVRQIVQVHQGKMKISEDGREVRLYFPNLNGET